ncbi:MAG: tetratricopeptide repeat protein [Candidatus Obscuribacterales bacterium]|nr:tetratricopeptide repeat protein [Candidatus Obscuribacterales bacterium]
MRNNRTVGIPTLAFMALVLLQSSLPSSALTLSDTESGSRASNSKIFYARDRSIRNLLAQSSDNQKRSSEWQIADSLFHQGKLNQSLSAWTSIISKDPTNAEAYKNFGEVLGAMKRFKDAIDALEYSLQLDSKLSGANKLLAEMYALANLPDKAKAAFAREVELQSGHSLQSSVSPVHATGIDAISSGEQIENIALRLFSEGAFEEAFAVAQQGAARGDNRCKTILGEMYVRGLFVNDKQKGIDLLISATDQSYAPAQHVLGMFYMTEAYGIEQDLKKAATLIKQSADQNYFGGHLAMGTCYLDGVGVSKDETKAKESFELALDTARTHLEVEPESDRAAYTVAISLLLLGRQEEARQAFQGYLRQHRYWILYDGYCSVLKHLKRWDDMHKAAKTFLEICPAYKRALYMLTTALIGQGNVKKAALAAEQAKEVDPNSPYPYTLLISIYLDQQMYSQAARQAEEALRTLVDPPTTLYCDCAFAFYKAKKYKDAEEAIRSAIAQGGSWRSYYLLGLIFEQQDNYNQAQAMYEEAIRMNPHSRSAMDALNRVMNN